MYAILHLLRDVCIIITRFFPLEVEKVYSNQKKIAIHLLPNERCYGMQKILNFLDYNI